MNNTFTIEEYIPLIKRVAIASNPEFNFDCNKRLITAYGIPILKNNQDCYVFEDIFPIVNRLKDIAKDIDFKEDKNGNHNADAIGFLALLEGLAGKRYAHKLAYLVFNHVYWCPTCKKVLDLIDVDTCMDTPNKFVDYCLECQSEVIEL